MLRNIFKIFLITLILLNLATANSDKNTILNIKVKIDDKFRTSLNLDPNLYKIWIGTSDGRNQFSEPMESTPKKTYIPGLPGSAPLVEEVYTSGAVSESFNYMIDIYIDDSYNEEWRTNQMRYSIVEVWPAFGAGDRKNKKINIISMPFQSPSGSTQETNELKKLEENPKKLRKCTS